MKDSEFELLSKKFGVLDTFMIKDYIKSCFCLTTVCDFLDYTLWLKNKIEEIIINKGHTDVAFLYKHENEIMQIRPFFGKAINYIRRNNAGLPITKEEQSLLDELKRKLK